MRHRNPGRGLGNPREAAGNYLEVVADIRAPLVGVADNHPEAEAEDNRPAAEAEDNRPEAEADSRREVAVVGTRREEGVVDRSSGLPEVVSA